MTTGPVRPRRRTRALAALIAAAAIPLAAPAAASAVTIIDGSPLNVHVGGTGQLQASFDGSSTGEFFPPGDVEGNAGFNLATEVGGQSPELWGYLGQTPTAGSQSGVTGDGSGGNPFQVVTTYSVGPTAGAGASFTITQTVTYVNGETRFGVQYVVTRDDTGPATVVRPSLSADLYIGGSDVGTGFLTPGPPRIVGGVNPDVGASGGIVELTPWAAFEEDTYFVVDDHIQDTSPTSALDNSINPASVDNGVGVAWPNTTISGSTSAVSYAAQWRFTRFNALALTPQSARNVVGATQNLTVISNGVEGQPQAGVNVHYTIGGANTVTGIVTTDANGVANIAYVGQSAGTDLASAFADLDGDGQRDASEPDATASIEWLSQPVAGRTFNLEPVEGEVFVRLPRGASPARYGLADEARKARAAQAPRGFIPLQDAAQIPVRSLVDTSRGKVLVQSAQGTGGGVQTAQFFSGRFQVLQRRARRAVTEMVMKGGSFRSCGRSRSSDAEASRHGRRVRRLWGNGRGRFRTRGRYSSATVRGTQWLVEDGCRGTLTRLPRRPRGSRVTVRDFVRRTTVTLRSGQSYTARPRR